MELLERNLKISVIIPFYNAKIYLERCVRSLLTQTFSEMEFVLSTIYFFGFLSSGLMTYLFGMDKIERDALKRMINSKVSFSRRLI